MGDPVKSQYLDILHHALLASAAVAESRGYEFVIDLWRPDVREGMVSLEFSRVIWQAPRPDDLTALAIGLHECGHIMHGDLWAFDDRFFGRPETPALRSQMEAYRAQRDHPQEIRASQFALRLIAAHDLPAEDALPYLCQALVTIGVDEMEADLSLRRGWTRPPFEVGLRQDLRPWRERA